MPRTGLEPACLSTHAPETCASTIPPPGHYGLSTFAQQTLERKTRLELATLTLARLCSTNWAISAFSVKEMRLELTRHNCHHPLKVARLPIPPFLQKGKEKNCFRGAQNRTRTCMPLDTRTWNVRVYHSATWALLFFAQLFSFTERKTRLELATLTLARLCSTNWAISALFLQPFIIFPIASAKVVLFSKLPKLSTIFFWKKWQISLASQAPLRYLPTLFPIKTPCKWTFRKALRTVSKSIFQQPKKHKDIWLKTYLRFKSNVLVFWLKRTCVWIKTLRRFFTNA